VVKFALYLIRWISQNLAVPFWMVGHIHLTSNVYGDVKEILMSLGLNIVVAIGFMLDYRIERKNDRAADTKQTNKRT